MMTSISTGAIMLMGPTFAKPRHIANLIQHHSIPPPHSETWLLAVSKNNFLSWNTKAQQSCFQYSKQHIPFLERMDAFIQMYWKDWLPWNGVSWKKTHFDQLQSKHQELSDDLSLRFLGLVSFYFYNPGFSQLRRLSMCSLAINL